jgi:predicted phosphodiesterase
MTELADALLAPAAPSKAATLGKIADLLERNGIDVDDVGKVARMNLWQMGYVDKDGEAQTQDLVGVSLSPSWAEGPQWPVVQPGPIYKLPTSTMKPVKVDGWQTCVILPDIQIGFYRNAAGELEPIHDEAALRVALAIVKAERPDVVVMVGDNLDLAEMSKYRLTAPYAQTTQATIDRGALLVAEVRAVAPDARIMWIEGNHEARLPNTLIDNARAAFGLRRGNTFAEPPVMSVPFLCRFDEYGIEYLPGYPASKFWVNERLRVIHGHKVKSGGSTAHSYLATEKTSVVFGHVHRREYASRAREDHDGPKEIMAASPGCLCRVDGVVPSTKGGYDLDGRPVPTVEDWAQGLAVVKYEPGDGRFVYNNIAIHEGWALWNGREYKAA